jgi:hypothetical protein
VIASPQEEGESESWRDVERKRPYWRIALAVATAAVALALPGAGRAALLGDALPGLLSPVEENPDCETNAYQAFKVFGDSDYYVITPGGAFEGKTTWTLKKGAKTAAGNEPWYVHSSSDKQSLYLPKGASALSPPMCFAFADWHMRFFARDGGSGGKVHVSVEVTSLLGLVSILDAGYVNPASGWRPSPRVSLLLTNLGGLLATDTIRLRLTASGGSVQVDDVFLDPWKNT